MPNPKVNTLTELFLPDGYGYFQYGAGVYGGYSEFLNPQWNTNSGNYGVDSVTGLPFIEATSSPSYLGASLYDAEYNSFFCKITPAAPGNGTVQTAIILRANTTNYVEMSVGPQGVFNAYVSNNAAITLPTTPMPVYNPTAHAFWRIRNDDTLVFHFDTSPDGSTWTELCEIPYYWDASSVTVMLFAGYTGAEALGNNAFITYINAIPGATISGKAQSVFSVHGVATVNTPVFLTGRASGTINFKASNISVQTLPEGGITDFTYGWSFNYVPGTFVDPLMIYGLAGSQFQQTIPSGGPTITQPSWGRAFYPYQVTQYKDNSYWPDPVYAEMDINLGGVPDSNYTVITNSQIEKTTGLQNRLSLDAYIYDTTCCYGPAVGVASVTRVTSPVLTGQYSGKIVGNGQNTLLPSGSYAYYINPESTALVPVKYFIGNVENINGTVSLNTSRAGTQWFASLVYFDATYQILPNTTYEQATLTNINTHPGNNVWQTGAVNTVSVVIPAPAAYVGVVPVVIVPTSSTAETVYASNHVITGVSAWISEQPTTYSNPRTANINVIPDRLNYCANSGFNTNTTLWFQTNTNSSGTPNPVTMSWDGTEGYNSLGSMKLSFVAPSGSFTGSTGGMGASSSVDFFGGPYQYPPVQGLLAGHTYTISAWIQQSDNCPDVYMNFYDSNYVGFQMLSTNNTKILYPENIDGSWTRISYTYTVPPQGLTDYGMYFFVLYSDYITATKPFSFWVDSILVDETTELDDYFDGSFPSIDYMWETGGTPNLCRSYYYEDYANKFVRLNKVLPTVLPVGESYNLKFAIAPIG